MATAANRPDSSIVRYRCETYPNLKVRVASDRDGDFEQIVYVEFRSGILDLNTEDTLYAQTVAALERARNGGTPIALIGEPSDDEDILAKLTCREFRCGHISRNEAAAKAHRDMHVRQTQVANEAPDRDDD